MNLKQRTKVFGFYPLVLAIVIATVAIIRFLIWAPANDAMNMLILLPLILGVVVNLAIIFYDNDYLMIVITALYSIALFQLLVDSIGSFVDAFQGIVMFGDPTQVGKITGISILITLSILCSIVAGFSKRQASKGNS